MNEDEKPYLLGTKNRLIRYYFYLSNGLDLLNQFRNLFLGIIAIYIALKLTNPVYMILMTIPCIIILTIIGYYAVHYVSKIKDWLAIKFGSHFGIKTFNYQKQMAEELHEIKNILNNGKRN